MWDQERNYHKINVTLYNVSSESTVDTVVVVGCKALLQSVDKKGVCIRINTSLSCVIINDVPTWKHVFVQVQNKNHQADDLGDQVVSKF